MDLNDVTNKIVAIVAIKSQAEAKELASHMHMPYYQVTINPEQSEGNTNGYSPTKNFIRFGFSDGDELNGWQPAHEIEIFEVLAEFKGDELIKIQDNYEVQYKAEPIEVLVNPSDILEHERSRV